VTPVFNRNPITDWANQAVSPRALVDLLKGHDVTHVLVNRPELERLSEQYGLFPLDTRGKHNWKGLQALARLVYRDQDCDVFEL
jgi:hypothetical protein